MSIKFSVELSHGLHAHTSGIFDARDQPKRGSRISMSASPLSRVCSFRMYALGSGVLSPTVSLIDAFHSDHYTRIPRRSHHRIFPRRLGLSPLRYAYSCAGTLQHLSSSWNPVRYLLFSGPGVLIFFFESDDLLQPLAERPTL